MNQEPRRLGEELKDSFRKLMMPDGYAQRAAVVDRLVALAEQGVPEHIKQISIPTHVMEAEFQAHYARGFEAGRAEQAPGGVEPAEGWVLVPKEPTKEMCVAVVKYVNSDAVYNNVPAKALEIEESIYAEAYRAMLAARPGADGEG